MSGATKQTFPRSTCAGSARKSCVRASNMTNTLSRPPRNRQRKLQSARQRKASQMSEALKQASEKEGAIVPASKGALVNGGSPVSAYLAAHGVGMAGTFFRFGKHGKFQ